MLVEVVGSSCCVLTKKGDAIRMMISLDLQKTQTDTKSVLISSLRVTSKKAFFYLSPFFVKWFAL